jgi:hypothetical protein
MGRSYGVAEGYAGPRFGQDVQRGDVRAGSHSLDLVPLHIWGSFSDSGAIVSVPGPSRSIPRVMNSFR